MAADDLSLVLRIEAQSAEAVANLQQFAELGNFYFKKVSDSVVEMAAKGSVAIEGLKGVLDQLGLKYHEVTAAQQEAAKSAENVAKARVEEAAATEVAAKAVKAKAAADTEAAVAQDIHLGGINRLTSALRTLANGFDRSTAQALNYANGIGRLSFSNWAVRLVLLLC